ncbi:MAG: hypothetical protein OXG83_02980 [Acidobacteria bacterium]|nr:hypothetical protein [Acidobacteriota bacterium]
MASDIFTLNTPLAATIEEAFVQTLNSLRPVWDPESRYQDFAFSRQAQTFPDVLLRAVDNGTRPLMGVELKGWYLLAKEKEPTFRFNTTEAAINPWDLLVVVPWVLSNVLSGSPILFPPFVKSALYCAQQRTYYWQHERDAQSNVRIDVPLGAHPYPEKRKKVADKARHDQGGNFGRIARYGVMNEYVEKMLTEKVRGIEVENWIRFFLRETRS